MTSLPKDLAYGMKLLASQANSFKYRLAASKKLFFYLNYDKSEGARIYVTINNLKMYLDRMFVQLKLAGLSTKVDYVLFYFEDSVHKLVLKRFLSN